MLMNHLILSGMNTLILLHVKTFINKICHHISLLIDTSLFISKKNINDAAINVDFLFIYLATHIATHCKHRPIN